MNETTPGTPESSAADFGLDAVRELIELIGQTDITEILIERHGVKLHVKRGVAGPQSAFAALPDPVAAPRVAPVQPPQPFAAAAEQPVEMPAGYTVAAPMVGTFYAAPLPHDLPFVQEGDEVRVGEPVGIIEAMRMMNEIESEVAGRIVRILVKNGQPVEYGQPLMVIEPF